MSLAFYDRSGRPIAYTSDGEHLYTYTGQPVAYLNSSSVYDFGGRHLGRFENGLIRDNHGHVAFYTEGSSGGPVKPVRQVQPVKGVRQVRPVKGVRQVKPVKPVSSLSWSQLSGPHFFA
ncbi:4-fold beta flower protein [Xanthomonas arboricola]|uniref:4-fold beta flower protein n=1 Tax=Xanthomonas arboricola TaxID=56448 RepID=UPI0011B06326|nr:hypothetical protein [Xanthomonas arboricola]